jgi:cell division control protein CDC15
MIPLPPHFTMMPLPMILSISHDLIQAVKYLHDNHFVHGDIKSDNILFDANGVLKLADFGVSTRDNECHTSAPWSGTLSWKSPNSMNLSTAFPEKDDIWSVGMVLLELLGIPPPFLNMQDQHQLFRSIRDLPGYQVPKFDYYGDDFELRMRGILDECFRMDPTERYSAEELLILFELLFPSASR